MVRPAGLRSGDENVGESRLVACSTQCITRTRYYTITIVLQCAFALLSHALSLSFGLVPSSCVFFTALNDFTWLPPIR